MKGEDQCNTNIRSLRPINQPPRQSSLTEILDQLVGCLSKFSNGKESGSTTSPDQKIVINLTINLASGGGATVNSYEVKK